MTEQLVDGTIRSFDEVVAMMHYRDKRISELEARVATFERIMPTETISAVDAVPAKGGVMCNEKEWLELLSEQENWYAMATLKYVEGLETENKLLTRAIVAHQERSIRYAYTPVADDVVKVGDFIGEEI